MSVFWASSLVLCGLGVLFSSILPVQTVLGISAMAIVMALLNIGDAINDKKENKVES